MAIMEIFYPFMACMGGLLKLDRFHPDPDEVL
jgi:hypothetical protein